MDSLDKQWAFGQGLYYRGCNNGTNQLGDDVEDKPDEANSTSKEQTHSNIGIEQAACDAEPDPGGYQQAEAKGSRDGKDLDNLVICGRGR